MCHVGGNFYLAVNKGAIDHLREYVGQSIGGRMKISVTSYTGVERKHCNVGLGFVQLVC